MTIRYSTGISNYILNGGSYKQALQGGQLQIFSGAQPANADAAPTGTLLCTFTDASGAHTNEVLSTGSFSLDSGASGSINTVTVNSIEVMGVAVPFNTTLTQTAADVAAQINRWESAPNYLASSSGAVVTIIAMRGTGTTPNTLAVVATPTTIGVTNHNMAGGVAAVNGLKFDNPVAGVMDKHATQVWTGVAAATGVAGWFRFVGATADSGIADSTASQIRMDGAISTAGAQINMTNTTITSGATETVPSFPITLPLSA